MYYCIPTNELGLTLMYKGIGQKTPACLSPVLNLHSKDRAAS